MANLLREKRYKRLIYSKPILTVLIILLFFVAKAAWNVYEKSSVARSNVALAQEELNEVENRYNEIKKDLDALNTKSGVEAEIRNTYGLGKKGEHVVIIVDEEVQATSTEPRVKVSIWQKIKNVFR